MDYLEDFTLEDMLATAIAGLDLVREAIVDHNSAKQPASHAMHGTRDDEFDASEGDKLLCRQDVPFDAG